MPIHLGNDAEEEKLINSNPFSFLLAMLLDQQISIVWAFKGPNRILQKLNAASTEADFSALSPEQIVEWDKEDFIELICSKPTIHRYPTAMAKRIYELSEFLLKHYDGEATALWKDQTSAKTVSERIQQLPGFGKEKTQITLAALVKRFGHSLEDWETFAGPFADDQPRSVADAGSAQAYEHIKKWKKAQRQKGLAKTD